MQTTSQTKFTAFRDCFEAGMDFETAFLSAGFVDTTNARDHLGRLWARWEAAGE
jgi:hypothetical protein